MALIGRKKVAEIISTEAHAGLRIVIVEVSEVDEYYSNTIVVKSGLKSLTKTPLASSSTYFSTNNTSTSAPSSPITSNGGDLSYCFLKSCHLCNKPLSPDKDVYMYRGDQGFCSVECRNRQIMLDDMKEMDEKMKKKKKLKDDASSAIDCVGCETCRLLEDLRKRRYQRNANKYKPAHELISPAKHHQLPLLSFS
ncbi:Protein MARD1 [Bienertia sinuspersici]